jgi:hypothetical protein
MKDIPVYYISPKQSAELEQKLYDAGFTDFRWVETFLHHKKTIGVAMAHYQVLNQALLDDNFPFIVLEQDVSLMRNLPDSIHIPEGTDAIYLGASQWGLKNGKGGLHICVERQNGGLYRVYNMLAAHAIMYFSRAYVEFLIKGIEVFLQIPTNQDKMRAETMKYWNVYALATPLFYQTGRYMPHTKFVLPGKTNKPLSFFYM